MLYGISKWKTSLQLSNVSFKIGVLDGALTAAGGVGMFYLNKGIMWATTSIGTAICPGLGTAIGFTVGLIGSILVDIFLGGWITDWIDNNIK